MKHNKKHKDLLFRKAFSKKKDLLELYNALNGTHYTNVKDIEITTIDGAMYVNYKNDASFILDNILNLYEHQSTWNPNMPLRGVFYYAILYRKYEKKHKLNVYGRTQLQLPMPVYVVFCNASDMKEDWVDLRLTDMFPENNRDKACLECIAHVININHGHNVDIVNGCCRLSEYVNCITTIRDHCKDVDNKNDEALGERIEEAIDVCIEKGYLADILSEERAEVLDMFLDGCSVEEYVGLQVRDQVAQATEQVTQQVTQQVTEQVTEQVTQQVTEQVTQQGLYALVNSLKTYIPDIDSVTETIRKYKGFENITKDMVEKYW